MKTQSSVMETKFIYLCGTKRAVSNDQEMAQSERKSHSKNRGEKKTKLTIRYKYKEIHKGKDQEKAQSEKNPHSKTRDGK